MTENQWEHACIAVSAIKELTKPGRTPRTEDILCLLSNLTLLIVDLMKMVEDGGDSQENRLERIEHLLQDLTNKQGMKMGMTRN